VPLVDPIRFAHAGAVGEAAVDIALIVLVPDNLAFHAGGGDDIPVAITVDISGGDPHRAADGIIDDMLLPGKAALIGRPVPGDHTCRLARGDQIGAPIAVEVSGKDRAGLGEIWIDDRLLPGIARILGLLIDGDTAGDLGGDGDLGPRVPDQIPTPDAHGAGDVGIDGVPDPLIGVGAALLVPDDQAGVAARGDDVEIQIQIDVAGEDAFDAGQVGVDDVGEPGFMGRVGWGFEPEHRPIVHRAGDDVWAGVAVDVGDIDPAGSRGGPDVVAGPGDRLCVVPGGIPDDAVLVAECRGDVEIEITVDIGEHHLAGPQGGRFDAIAGPEGCHRIGERVLVPDHLIAGVLGRHDDIGIAAAIDVADRDPGRSWNGGAGDRMLHPPRSLVIEDRVGAQARVAESHAAPVLGDGATEDPDVGPRIARGASELELVDGVFDAIDRHGIPLVGTGRGCRHGGDRNRYHQTCVDSTSCHDRLLPLGRAVPPGCLPSPSVGLQMGERYWGGMVATAGDSARSWQIRAGSPRCGSGHEQVRTGRPRPEADGIRRGRDLAATPHFLIFTHERRKGAHEIRGPTRTST